MKRKARSVANNELGDFEFLVSIIIWYDILYAVNLVSKQLQSKDVLIDLAIKKLKGLVSFFEGYRETGFTNAINVAKDIACEISIDTTFPQRHEIRRKKHFDENSSHVPIVSQYPEESFRINYFLYIVDQAIFSLTRRFEQ